jgi:hypothetical protein
MIRSSADPDGMHLKVRTTQWQEFVAGVKDGDFDGL